MSKRKIDRDTLRKEYSLIRRLASWLVSPFYISYFFLTLILFHPLLVIANRFGYPAFKVFYDLMNACLVLNFRITGAKIRVQFEEPLPKAPFILVSNHQSMYDIPLIIWSMRGYHPMFIAKAELGKGLPSISFALRSMGGSALIDRSDPKSAIPIIEKYGRNAFEKGYVAHIFPEGTRARDGVIKPFKLSGLAALISNMPGTPIIPAVIDGSWELVRYNLWPVPWGTKLSITYLPAIQVAGRPATEIVSEVEAAICQGLERQRRNFVG